MVFVQKIQSTLVSLASFQLALLALRIFLVRLSPIIPFGIHADVLVAACRRGFSIQIASHLSRSSSTRQLSNQPPCSMKTPLSWHTTTQRSFSLSAICRQARDLRGSVPEDEHPPSEATSEKPLLHAQVLLTLRLSTKRRSGDRARQLTCLPRKMCVRVPRCMQKQKQQKREEAWEVE